ncbi:hypothetical protein HDU96_006707 [Phlyctochytrium bullatum]|nr:hypothetical protein HDU96_006707 [Phlyctochytrium bullatum]
MAEEETAQQELALSIEETNKLRISLGLKPLNDKVNSGSKHAAAEQNFANERRRQQRRLEREESQAKLNAKLDGKGLGAPSDDEDDPLSWAEKHKKALEKRKRKEAKIALKKAKEMDEMDSVVYSSGKHFGEWFSFHTADLAGLRVGHELSGITDEVLVLADKRILDEDENEDELVSVALTEKERRKKNLESKKGLSKYTGYDDEEFLNPGQQRKLLSQYDEVIDAPIRQGFVLQADGTAAPESNNDVSSALREGAVSLEFDKMQEIRDYYTKEEAASFNKPKKRKKRGKMRQTENDGVDLMEGLELPGGTLSNKDNAIEDVNFVDDDDLQEALSKARKLSMRKKPLLDAEAILASANDLLEETEADQGSGGLILSATSEFVNNLSIENAPRRREAAPSEVPKSHGSTEDKEPHVPHVDHVDEDRMDEDANTPSHYASEQEEGAIDEPDHVEQPTALAEEPLVSRGLGATMALLAQKGFLEKASPDLKEREEKQLKKQKWLAEQRLKDKLREIEKAKEKARNKAKGGKAGGYIDERKQEEEQRAAERKRMKELEDRFKDYNPDVNIKYTDQFGNNLDAKEVRPRVLKSNDQAFRYLSHKFHGKTSGKMKTEKRLRKKEEELKLQRLLSTDNPVPGLSTKPVQSASAHVVLSVGNKGMLPSNVSINDLKDPQSKKKSSKAKASVLDGDYAGGSYVTEVPFGESAQPIPSGNREKVVFGLSTKKRAQPQTEEEA